MGEGPLKLEGGAKAKAGLGPCLPVFHGIHFLMVEVRQTAAFSDWFDSLRDRQAQARINIRIRRLSLGNHGDVKPVGGGDKRSQDRDIRIAIDLASNL